MNVFINKGVVVDRPTIEEEYKEGLTNFLVTEDLADGNIGARFKQPQNGEEDGALRYTPQKRSLLEFNPPEREVEEFYGKIIPMKSNEGVRYEDIYVYEEDELVTKDSSPLMWIMDCEAGQEEEVIASLFRMFGNRASPFLAVFSLPSIKGYIFMEARWSEIPNDLVKELYNIDFIISADRPGPIHIRRVPADVFKSLVSLGRTQHRIQAGEWRRLRFAEYEGRQRLYRDEVALVEECDGFSAVVLVVPLIPRTGIREESLYNNPKIDYVRMLFDREELSFEYHQETIENNSFECGLWIRQIPVKNIGPIDNRPLTQREFLPFARSRHPSVISNFPIVSEWVFHVGEEVAYWWDETVTGVIESILDGGALVVAEDRSESDLDWSLLKLWTTGSEVISFDGYTGVVQSLLGNSIEVWDTKTFEPTHGIPITRYFHANELSRAAGSLLLNTKELLDYRKRRQKNPWKDMAIRVVAGPSKGRYEFIDILPGANTKSTFKASVRSAILNSQAVRTVDYDWIVCEKTGFPLHKVRRVAGWILKFPQGYKHPFNTVPAKPAPTLTLPPSLPPPSPIASTSSRRLGTPPVSERHESQRWLWDLPTIGYKFKVTILRDDKNIKVQLCVDEAVDVFSTRRVYWHRHNKDHELHHLVEIIPENPTRKAEKPYFVIGGEHKGKVLARVKGGGTELLSREVDIFEGTIKSEEYFTVKHLDCCMVAIEPSKMRLLQIALDPYKDEMS